MMVHAFMLLLFFGENKVAMGRPMYWKNIDHCNYYAEALVKRYGDFKDEVSAYCKPVYIPSNTPTLYDH